MTENRAAGPEIPAFEGNVGSDLAITVSLMYMHAVQHAFRIFAEPLRPDEVVAFIAGNQPARCLRGKRAAGRIYSSPITGNAFRFPRHAWRVGGSC